MGSTRYKRKFLSNSSFNFKIVSQTTIEIDCRGCITKDKFDSFNKLFTNVHLLHCMDEELPRNPIISLRKSSFKKIVGYLDVFA